VDAEHLRYRFLNNWNAALQALEKEHAFLSSSHQIVSYANDQEQVVPLALLAWPLFLPAIVYLPLHGLGQCRPQVQGIAASRCYIVPAM
jgi:hypothetical protein